MGWSTTADLDKFVAAAGRYLRSTAVENTLLLSAVQDARSAWDPRIAGRPPGTAPTQATGTTRSMGATSGSGTAPASQSSVRQHQTFFMSGGRGISAVRPSPGAPPARRPRG